MTTANGANKKIDTLTEEQQVTLKQKGAEIERLQADISALSLSLVNSEGAQAWSKHVTPGTLSVFKEEASWKPMSTEAQNSLMKRKYSADIRDANGSSWKKMKGSLGLDSSEDGDDDPLSEEGELSPTHTKFDVSERKIYGTLPMEEDMVILTCKTCQRPILASNFSKHSEMCGKGVKKPRALAQLESANDDKSKLAKSFFSDDDDDDDDGDNDPIARTADGKKKKKNPIEEDTPSVVDEESQINSSTPAKRPPSASEKPEKKKTKKAAPKAKATPKQKAPLDLDKQCGVVQPPSTTPCTRSLTCKSHSMGAKRSVPGRSQPYDVLLAAYQKKAIGRPQTTGVGAGDKKGTVIGSKTAKGNLKKTQGASGPVPANGKPSTEEQYVNSDEEVESVMNAIRSSRPAPLAVKPYYFVKRRRASYRLRDVLLDALTPKSNINHSESNGSVSSMLSGFGSTSSNNNNNSSSNFPSAASPSSSISSMPTSNTNMLQQQMSLPQRSTFQSYSMAAMLANNARLNQPLPSTISAPQGMIGFSGTMDNNINM